MFTGLFAAFSTQFGLTEKQALKIGACFGSGMCKGEVCGVVTVALKILLVEDEEIIRKNVY